MDSDVHLMSLSLGSRTLGFHFLAYTHIFSNYYRPAHAMSSSWGSIDPFISKNGLTALTSWPLKSEIYLFIGQIEDLLCAEQRISGVPSVDKMKVCLQSTRINKYSSGQGSKQRHKIRKKEVIVVFENILSLSKLTPKTKLEIKSELKCPCGFIMSYNIFNEMVSILR